MTTNFFKSIFIVNILIILISVKGTYAGFFSSLKELTYCRLTECCNSDQIPYDIKELESQLRSKMFGQPLVMEIVNILNAHKISIDLETSNKAEVISFHGWTGVGKNYVATIIANSLYKKGMDSEFVLMFQGQKAIDAGSLALSRELLLNKIEAAVRRCPKSLIIFDEVDEMDPEILDRIKFMLDHHKQMGADYSQALFIFISNIAGEEITTELLNLYSQGVKRKDVQFQDFEAIIRKASYFQGGFSKAAIITKSLIDHYIPFLPLEQSHVEQCAHAAFTQLGVRPTPEMWQDAMSVTTYGSLHQEPADTYALCEYSNTEDRMLLKLSCGLNRFRDALSVITYGPTEDTPMFSNAGCKRLTKHIPYVVEKHRKSRHSEL